MMMLGFSAAEERLMKKSEPIMGVEDWERVVVFSQRCR
jgi:hypothetical protein